MAIRSNPPVTYKILRIMRGIAFGALFFTLGYVAQDKTNTESFLLGIIALAYLAVFVMCFVRKISAEVYIWDKVSNAYGLVNVNDASVDFRKLPQLGPVIDAGVAERTVERAYVDQSMQSVLQQITCHYGGNGDSRLSFATSYITLTLRLSEDVPDIFIDGLKRNKFKKSPEMWALNKKLLRSTRLPTLEGDFGCYFTVYAPSQNQLEGVMIVTPDVMLELKNNGYEFDYELSGRSLTIIRDCHVTSTDDLAKFIDAAQVCAREIIPQITNHIFVASPPLPLQPWRTLFWGYVYNLRIILGWVLLMFFYVLIGSMVARYLSVTL